MYEGSQSFIIHVKVFLISKEPETSISEEILIFLSNNNLIVIKVGFDYLFPLLSFKGTGSILLFGNTDPNEIWV